MKVYITEQFEGMSVGSGGAIPYEVESGVVPRIGETVCRGPGEPISTVESVVWVQRDGELQPHVFCRQLPVYTSLGGAK